MVCSVQAGKIGVAVGIIFAVVFRDGGSHPQDFVKEIRNEVGESRVEDHGLGLGAWACGDVVDREVEACVKDNVGLGHAPGFGTGVVQQFDQRVFLVCTSGILPDDRGVEREPSHEPAQSTCPEREFDVLGDQTSGIFLQDMKGSPWVELQIASRQGRARKDRSHSIIHKLCESLVTLLVVVFWGLGQNKILLGKVMSFSGWHWVISSSSASSGISI